MDTCSRRRGRTLTLSGYAASGGVAGATTQTADSVFDALDTQQQTLARGIFLRLTELGEEGAQDTRRRVRPGELVRTEDKAPVVKGLLETLADTRLIITGEDTVEVAHEALIREWPLLRGKYISKDIRLISGLCPVCKPRTSLGGRATAKSLDSRPPRF